MVEQYEQSNAAFKALADPTRRAMLDRLADRELTVGELAEPLEMSLAAASKHIGVLEKAGLVKRRNEGRQRVCSLDARGLFAVRDWVQRYAAFWDARLDALDQALTNEKHKENGGE